MGIGSRFKSGLSTGLTVGEATGWNPWTTAAGFGAGFFLGGGGPKQPSWEDWNNRLQKFDLPSNMKFDYATDVDPYAQTAIQGINSAYGDSMKGLQGWISNYQAGPGYGAASAAAGDEQKAFNQAFAARQKGEAGLDSEIARINQLESKGYDIFSDPNALMEVAPEIFGASKIAEGQRANLAAYGPRGGVGASQLGQSYRDQQEAASLALANAVRQNRQTKLGISSARADRQALQRQSDAARALLNADTQMYGYGGQMMLNRAQDYGNFFRNFFDKTTNLQAESKQRIADVFTKMMSGQMNADTAMAQLDAQERAALNKMISEAAAAKFGAGKTTTEGGTATSDRRAKTSPGRVSSALKEISKLPAVYDYHYNALAGELEGTPGRGLMAQDIEKIPSMRHLVRKDPNGIRSVDVYGVASTALAAVKELDEKLSRMQRKKWRLSGRKVA